jgi:hypothetical protein
VTKNFSDKPVHKLSRSLSSLQLLDNRGVFMEVSTQMEATPMDIFIQHGWNHDLRVDPPSS